MTLTFTAMGGHHSKVPATIEWLTPPWLIEALGGWRSIGRDPCTPIEQPYPTARERWTILDDGLKQRWDPAERFFVNPPYTDGEIELWLAMLAEQGNGTALIFARTETVAFFRWGWERAHAAFFLRGRINFHVAEPFCQLRWSRGVPSAGRTFLAGDRMDKNSGAPSVLLAYGEEEAERLAESGIEGQFVPLIISRSVLVTAVRDVTWSELVIGAMQDHEGETVSIEAIWLAVRSHRKASGRKHVREKVRQILQRVGERVARGQYRMPV